MDVSFIKQKAYYFIEEILAVLADLTNEIKSNPNKGYTENEVKGLSNEFFNLINTKSSDLQKDRNYNDPKFIEYLKLSIVATIDDAFLTLNWSGREFWSKFLLEVRFFSTRASGDTFFKNCKQILHMSQQQGKELAAIYHLCLAAGFRGRFFDSEHNDEINTYRTDLYNFFNSALVDTKGFDSAAILPSGHIENKSSQILKAKYRFFNLLFWSNIIIIIVFIIVSYFVWFHNENLVFRHL